jgi:hypothetical protein
MNKKITFLLVKIENRTVSVNVSINEQRNGPLSKEKNVLIARKKVFFEDQKCRSRK